MTAVTADFCAILFLLLFRDKGDRAQLRRSSIYKKTYRDYDCPQTPLAPLVDVRAKTEQAQEE